MIVVCTFLDHFSNCLKLFVDLDCWGEAHSFSKCSTISNLRGTELQTTALRIQKVTIHSISF